MKNLIKPLLFCLFLTSYGVTSFAQSTMSEIVIKEQGLFKKKVYTKCGIDMTPEQLLNLFKNDPNMQSQYKPLVLNYSAALLLNSTASVLILWPVTESFFTDSNPNWNLAYAGAACALLAIPFQKAFDKRSAKAINYYNSGYKETARSLDFDLKMTPSGIGICMGF